MKRILTLAAMASILPLIFAAGAQAQTYTRLVSFGDSLTDNGNTFGLTGSPPAPYNKRFTNRLTWVEYLTGSSSTATTGSLGMMITATPGNVNTGSQDFAFGGARADNAPNSNGPLPSSGTQISTFSALGGKFGANDVASLWIGANDLFQAFPGAASNPATATTVMGTAANVAAATVGTQVTTLAGAGAKTILVMNLPNFSVTPQFSTASVGASGNQLAGFASSTFNSALNTTLTNVASANKGANIITVDVATTFSAIIANPGAFGLSNVTNQCLTTTACVTGGSAVQDTYLFWDGVHPTATGHLLMSKIASQYLYTPTLASGVSMMADQSYTVRHDQMLAMSDRLSQGKSSEGDSSYFFDLIGSQGKRNSTVTTQAIVGGTTTTSTASDYDYKMSGARAGVIQGIGNNASFGAGFSLLTGGTTKGFMVSAKPTSLNFDTALNWKMDQHFMTASFGIGIDTYQNYMRQTLLAPLPMTQDNLNTATMSAALEAGMSHDMGGMMVTPLVRLSYVQAHMQGFDEQGVVAPVSFSGRKVYGTSAGFELRASGKMSGGMALNGMIGYEGTISGKNADLRGHIIGNTAQPFSDSMGKLGNQGLLVGLGVETALSDGFKLSGALRANYGDHSQHSENAMISLSRRF